MATLNSGARKKGIRKEPLDNLGVFKSIEEVPELYHLSTHSREYEDRDVWAEWMTDEKDGLAESTRKYKYGRAEKLWKSHMENRGRHHALANPSDVESFLADQLDQVQKETVWNNRYDQIYQFYDWLTFHADYPHVYNPVLMAAVNRGAAREMWDYRVQKLIK
ncbi:hypothetical protein [Natrinema sp. SYSU A 869]|uniref:hypothetical protein n=1 Tax=Natrinema sp. SYSU A 869 TaxID=2871694 RepID=UPI001CA42D31|nr:hypothetical protein [Natrinema sp. SYSU A 869]